MIHGHLKTDRMICFEKVSRKCQVTMCNEISHDVSQIWQCTIIPWFKWNEDSKLEFVNVTVGMSTCENVASYAARIWSSVTNSLENRDIYITACGSATAAVIGLDWFMIPYLACGSGIFVYERVVASKVKGLVRDLLDSVRFSSPADVGQILEPVRPYILEKIEHLIVAAKVAPHNQQAFTYTKKI